MRWGIRVEAGNPWREFIFPVIISWKKVRGQRWSFSTDWNVKRPGVWSSVITDQTCLDGERKVRGQYLLMILSERRMNWYPSFHQKRETEMRDERWCLVSRVTRKFGWQVTHSLNSFLSLNFTEFLVSDHDSLLSILSFTWSCPQTLFLNFLYNSSECISQGTDTEISYFFVTVANDCLFIMTFEWIHPNPLSSRQSKQDMKGWDFLFLLPLILSLFLLRSLQTWK